MRLPAGKRKPVSICLWIDGQLKKDWNDRTQQAKRKHARIQYRHAFYKTKGCLAVLDVVQRGTNVSKQTPAIRQLDIVKGTE